MLAAGANVAPATEIARDGKALLPVVIGAGADEKTARAAGELAVYLGRICGGEFRVERGDGSRGIVVGCPEDFPALPFRPVFETHVMDPDHYLLRSGKDGLYVIGSTPQAAAFAVWDVLYRMGHRHYFPGEKWEIVPSRRDLALEIDVLERPSYFNRSGPRGAARATHRPWRGDSWEQWRERNRATPGFQLHTGHAYDGILRRNAAAFEAHPEFFAVVNGRRENRPNPKFCVGNEALRRLVVEDALRRFEADPSAQSLSMDPSDGGGWCDDSCELCQAVGSVSDRVVLLANEVAAALEERAGRPVIVGIYAYNDYSLPPTIPLHPNVIPSLATAFIRGEQTFDQMLEGWSPKAARIGIREYYAVSAWNSAMPGQARAADLDYLAETIATWHEKGARFMNAESDDSWGPNGLGYWLAARMLWDVREARQKDALVEDFLQNAFGPAAPPMRRFYAAITGRPHLSEHLVGSMFRFLNEARALAREHPDVLARLDDLALYTRCVELQRAFAAAPASGQQAAFDRLNSFAWRMRGTLMADALGIIDFLQRAQRDKEHLAWADGYLKVAPSAIHRTDEDKPFSAAEIDEIIADGIAANQLLSFEPVGYSLRLVPASKPLGLPEGRPLARSARTRARAENYTWLPAETTVRLRIRTGLLHANRGNATVALEWWNEDTDEFENIAEATVPPDQQWHEVSLKAAQPGLHRVVWDERMSGTEVEWPAGLPRTTPAGSSHFNITVGRDNWYFYVPRGTTLLGMQADIAGGQLMDPRGRVVRDFDRGGHVSDYLTVEVPPGTDGALWSFRNLSGQARLLTVPPFASSDPGGLLLPRELVERERTKS